MKIAVVGFGKMGRFLVQILKKEHEILIIDSNLDKWESDFELQIYNRPEIIPDFDPDVLLNAVPLHLTVSLFKQLEPLLRTDCVRADIASVKNEVAIYYQSRPYPFCSFHPMFGPVFADMNQLDGEQVVFISESDSQVSHVFSKRFQEIGLHVLQYSFAEHDRLIATGLSLPFLMTLGFCLFKDAPTLPGSTYRRHWEICKTFLQEDPSLISEILMNPNTKWLIDRVVDKMNQIKELVDQKDGIGLRTTVENLMASEKAPRTIFDPRD